MSESALLNAYVDAWNRGDVQGVMSFFADSFTYTDMVMHETFDARSLEVFLTRTFESFEELAFEVVSVSPSNQAIAWEWRMKGRRADGTTIDEPGMSMTVLTGGKISRNTDYWSRLKAPPR